MPKVTMKYVALSCYSDKVSGTMSFEIDGMSGAINIPMKPEEAERLYAQAISVGQQAYSDYVGMAIDIPLHVPACLPDLRAMVNTPEPYDTIEKLDADEIRRNEIDKDDENPF